MLHFRLRLTSWDDPSCRRVWLTSGANTLAQLHSATQREFELGGDGGEGKWAYFLSGELEDPATEFGNRSGAASPGVALSTLSLEPGLRAVYVSETDGVNAFHLDVVSIEDVEASEPVPRVVEREGSLPTERTAEEWEAEKPDEELPEVLSAHVELAEQACDLLDDADTAAKRSAVRSEALRIAEALLDACPDGNQLDALTFAAQVNTHGVLSDLLKLAFDGGVDSRLEALERRFSRLPDAHRHDHGFAPSLLEHVRWLDLRWDWSGQTPTERCRRLSAEERAKCFEEILEACQTPGRLSELACQTELDELRGMLSDHLQLTATSGAPAALGNLLERANATLGAWGGTLDAAAGLGAAGRPTEALALLDPIDANSLSPTRQLELASALDAAGAPERAESLYRGLLGRRWLSGRNRRLLVEEYAAFLEGHGRSAEARRLERDERDRRQGGSSVVRTGPKVKPNDPCPCGSGKKAKKCCGVT